MEQPLDEFWCDISAYVHAALELDAGAREHWVDGLHACAPVPAARLRAYLVELGALAGNDLVALDGNVDPGPMKARSACSPAPVRDLKYSGSSGRTGLKSPIVN